MTHSADYPAEDRHASPADPASYVGTESTGTEAADTESADTDFAGTDHARTDHAATDYSSADYSSADVASTDYAGADAPPPPSPEPEPADADATSPAAGSADSGSSSGWPAHSDPAHSDGAQSSAAHPDVTGPDPSYPGAPYPGASYPGAPYPNAAGASQPYPDQPYPDQPYPDQPYPGQAYPAPAYPAPAYPAQPGEAYPVHPAQAYPAGYRVPPGAPQPNRPGEAAPPAPHTPLHAPPPVPPKPEDLLVPNHRPLDEEPASWGWRGRVNRASGGLLKPKAAASEVAVRQAIRDLQRSFSRPMTIVVAQPKGGAGKTPTTICLAAAFGAHRGGYVLGWDDNETRGTLAVRVSNPSNQHATVWDLLGDLTAFERFDARVGDLSYYVRPQPGAHFDALVSDNSPGNMAQIGEDEFHRLHKVLQRFYRMIVIDTGNNVRSPNWQAAVNAADILVVVSTYQRDVGYSGSWVLDHLAQTGREDLARNAVTVLTAADPTTDKGVRTQLLRHFEARTRAVIEIPYDQEIAHGGPIQWGHLAPQTRNAWVRAAGAIANRLGEQDKRALDARRT